MLLAGLAALVPVSAHPQTRTLAEIDAELESREAEVASLRQEREVAAALAAAKRDEAELVAKLAEAKARIAQLSGASTANTNERQFLPGAVQETRTETTTTTEGGTVVEEKKVTRAYAQTDLRDVEDPTQKFGGIEFGIGIAFSYDLGDNDRIKEAELVNGIVRVTDRENVRARIILESHYFFTPTGGVFGDELFGLKNLPGKNMRKEWGIGPFVALQPGTNDVIDALGAGIMVGFRRPNSETQSFNIGVGVLYDLNTRLLGEGLAANQPLPSGETAIRYLEEEQSGLLLLSSYSF